tara:strand:- start:661 stop:846 length:186 start_codon:yes stop_codon:yes gene_type:complete
MDIKSEALNCAERDYEESLERLDFAGAKHHWLRIRDIDAEVAEMYLNVSFIKSLIINNNGE